MNFLAHIYLSGDDQDVLLGNFIGDFVKGSELSGFSETVQKGIRLHREIDSFTDNHPIVYESKQRLREKYRHYASVIVDIYYDHLLAANWISYSDTPLLDFTLSFYDKIQGQSSSIPHKAAHMLFHMEKGNWLFHYKDLEGIEQALIGMSRRTKFDSQMEKSVDELREFYEDFHKEFETFFPELIEFSKKYLEEEK